MLSEKYTPCHTKFIELTPAVYNSVSLCVRLLGTSRKRSYVSKNSPLSRPTRSCCASMPYVSTTEPTPAYFTRSESTVVRTRRATSWHRRIRSSSRSSRTARSAIAASSPPTRPRRLLVQQTVYDDVSPLVLNCKQIFLCFCSCFVDQSRV